MAKVMDQIAEVLFENNPVKSFSDEQCPDGTATDKYKEYIKGEYMKFAVKLRDGAISKVLRGDGDAESRRRIDRLITVNANLTVDSICQYSPINDNVELRDIVGMLVDIGQNMGAKRDCRLNRFHFWADSTQIREMVEDVVPWCQQMWCHLSIEGAVIGDPDRWQFDTEAFRRGLERFLNPQHRNQ